jgi:hypothetical protein
MRMWKRIATSIAVCAIASVTAVAAPPRLQISEKGGEASGLTPGGESVWFVVTVQNLGGMPWRSRVIRVLNDTDGDGVTTLELPVSRSAVWVVADFQTGDYVVATAAGHKPTELQAKGPGWTQGVESADFDLLEVDSLLVRPRRGVWVNYSQADGRGDADPAPKNLKIRLSDMLQMHGSEKRAAGVVLPKDIFVAIDRETLQVFVRAAEERGQ